MKVAILGAAGMQGQAVFHDLCQQDDVEEIHLADNNVAAIVRMKERTKDKAILIHDAIRHALQYCDIAINCLPYHMNVDATRIAIESKCSMVDLGGNNDIVENQFKQSAGAKAQGVLVIPDCGLAPGIPSILTAQAVDYFDTIDDVTIQCGGLPALRHRYVNVLSYATVFSIHGLLNEYAEDALTLYNHKEEKIKALSIIHKTYFKDYRELTCSPTSGGLSTLTRTFRDKIKNLSYSTIRYPGHFEWFKTLKYMGLLENKEFRKALEASLTTAFNVDVPDVVLFRMFITASRKGKHCNREYELELYGADGLTAMTRATGFSASAVALMIGRGEIKERGVIPQELCVDPAIFLAALKDKGIDIEMTDYESRV